MRITNLSFSRYFIYIYVCVYFFETSCFSILHPFVEFPFPECAYFSQKYFLSNYTVRCMRDGLELCTTRKHTQAYVVIRVIRFATDNEHHPLSSAYHQRFSHRLVPFVSLHYVCHTKQADNSHVDVRIYARRNVLLFRDPFLTRQITYVSYFTPVYLNSVIFLCVHK